VTALTGNKMPGQNGPGVMMNQQQQVVTSDGVMNNGGPGPGMQMQARPQVAGMPPMGNMQPMRQQMMMNQQVRKPNNIR
jgi:hypothetical protein